MSPPRVCPICGTLVPPDARACPGCGSDEQTGWSETAFAPQPDLAEEEFDYDEFVKREFGGGSHFQRHTRKLWVVVAIAVFAVLLLLWLKFK